MVSVNLASTGTLTPTVNPDIVILTIGRSEETGGSHDESDIHSIIARIVEGLTDIRVGEMIALNPNDRIEVGPSLLLLCQLIDLTENILLDLLGLPNQSGIDTTTHIFCLNVAHEYRHGTHDIGMDSIGRQIVDGIADVIGIGKVGLRISSEIPSRSDNDIGVGYASRKEPELGMHFLIIEVTRNHINIGATLEQQIDEL